MKVTPLTIPDVLLIEPEIFYDERGFFLESFNQDNFDKVIGCKLNFVQDNHSKSLKGVLRGHHYQREPKAQGKLVRVIQGEVFDIVVDIRKSSPSFGKWIGEILTSENQKQIWIPEGFAHGFLTLSETAEVLYKTTDFYDKNYECSLLWNDEDLNINWPTRNPILSEKDRQANLFKDIVYFY